MTGSSHMSRPCRLTQHTPFSPGVHVLALACTSRLALPRGLPQCSYALGSQGDPAGAMRCLLDVLQASCTTPRRDGAYVPIQEVCGRPRGVAAITGLPVGTDAWRLGAASGNGIGIAEPGHFRRREDPAQSWSGAFVIQCCRYLAVRVVRGQRTDTGDDGGRGA